MSCIQTLVETLAAAQILLFSYLGTACKCARCADDRENARVALAALRRGSQPAPCLGNN